MKKIHNAMMGVKKKSWVALILVITLATVLATALYVSNEYYGFRINTDSTVHCEIKHYRNGLLIGYVNHPMTETNYGKNQTRNLLGGASTKALLYLANSNDTTEVDTSWTSLIGETVSCGLARALGTFVLDNSADGKWNVTYTWTATIPITACLYGVYSDSGTSATLCYAEQQGAGNLRSLLANDLLVMTVQGTVS